MGRSRWLFAMSSLLHGCQFHSGRSVSWDLDGDGVDASADCNDEQASVRYLEAWDGELQCGDVVDGEFRGAKDRFDYINCSNPDVPHQRAYLGDAQRVYSLVTSVDTDVELVHDGPGMQDVYVINGPECQQGSCVSPLPTTPAFELQTRTFFRADAHQQWFAILVGHVGKYSLEVNCLADVDGTDD